MLRHVQSFDLVLFWYAHAGNQIRYLQQHDRSDQRKSPGNQNADELASKLAGAFAKLSAQEAFAALDSLMADMKKHPLRYNPF